MAINARDAMPNGGKLMLETRNVVLDEAYAQANPRRAARPLRDARGQRHRHRHVQRRCSDKVFEPFFTTKEVGKGTGLGLSMVYGFVKQSGGHIKIYSEEGHGTTIKLYLPRGARPGAEAAVPRPRRWSGGDETILVVEDDELVRNFVITQLQSLGYQTLDAADGRRGAAAMIESGSDIRPAVHRRHHARRHERPATRRRGRRNAGPA